MKYLASCSFGKDSLAAILVRIQRGEPVDGAVYCQIMFDDGTGAELPGHEEWIHTCAIPLLKSRYGIETAVVRAAHTYRSLFYRVFKKGKRAGQIYGFPLLRGPWCNSRLKVHPIDTWGKAQGEHAQIIGIAADERTRLMKATVSGKILPLAEAGIAEAEAFGICRRANLLSPAYDGDRRRLGCWFCHNQRIGELRRLRKEHPVLWDKLMALDKDSPVAFKPQMKDCESRMYLRDYDERFKNEDAQMMIANF